MSIPAAFSRLQLAAALLEYDNDPDDPTQPYRSAQDSAIFAHLRRNPAARPDLVYRKSDHLGITLPSDSTSLGGRESALGTRRSRISKSSVDALRNPFGVDTTSEIEGVNEAEEEEGGLEVDLASWGLDAFMPKDKAKSMKGKGKQPIPAVVSTSIRRPSTSYENEPTHPRRAVVTSKSASLGGNLEDLQIDSPVERRRSFGSPLDLAGMEPHSVPFHRNRAASQASLIPTTQTTVPFPTTSARSPSPGAENAYTDSRPSMHNRAYSSASLTSRLILDREDPEGTERNISNDISGSIKPPDEDNPFAIQNPSHISRFDPKSVSRARSHSNASLGSRMLLENDDRSVITGDPYARDRPYSTMELLRPKVLVMPSPLQPITPQNSNQPTYQVRDGFELSADGPPLPAGARASRRLSSSMSLLEAEIIPVASNSFTPNPLMDLSLSQKTFRNTLVVPGQTSYLEGMNKLPTATEEGEQAQLDPSGQEESMKQLPPAEGPSKASRPPGKLYGKSLIDDLEDRKLQMRNKQRVFTGDQRPSMMAREQHHASTLIDPASLQRMPTNERLSSHVPPNTQGGLARHQSLTIKPLLTFDDGEDNKPLQPSPTANRLPVTRSVFGVDTLWQREMSKLKEIEAEEQKEKVERERKQKEAELKGQKKKEKRKKGKQKEDSVPERPEHGATTSPIPLSPPTLPDIPRASRRAPPKLSDSDISSDSSDNEAPLHPSQKEPSWHVDSSDEDEAGPRRTTGTGPRYPKQSKKNVKRIEDDDSDEDVPLAATLHKAEARALMRGTGYQDSEDEDRPLSHVRLRTKTGSSPIKYQRPALVDDYEDDDQPLGLRVSRMTLKSARAQDEDDVPLAFHPEQQRRTQYQILAQQQQQMMMHAQLQSNMMMNASMMGQPYFPPTMMHPMSLMGMQVPIPVPSPPPLHDEAKLSLVDRWRRDVVVEGENM